MSSTAQSLAGKRIYSLLDENSFVEIGGCVTARNTDFNLFSTYLKKKRRQMVLLPDTASLMAVWSMFTVRMHLY